MSLCTFHSSDGRLSAVAAIVFSSLMERLSLHYESFYERTENQYIPAYSFLFEVNTVRMTFALNVSAS